MNNTSSTSNPVDDRSLHLQYACTLLVAAGAAYVSYRHGRDFALRFGADTTTATLWPLIVDGLLLIATIELWKTSHQHRPSEQWKAWFSFALGIALSLRQHRLRTRAEHLRHRRGRLPTAGAAAVGRTAQPGTVLIFVCGVVIRQAEAIASAGKDHHDRREHDC